MPELSFEAIVALSAAVFILLSLLVAARLNPGSAGRWILALAVVAAIGAAGYFVLSSRLGGSAAPPAQVEQREELPQAGAPPDETETAQRPPRKRAYKSAPPPSSAPSPGIDDQPDPVGEGAPDARPDTGVSGGLSGAEEEPAEPPADITGRAQPAPEPSMAPPPPPSASSAPPMPRPAPPSPTLAPPSPTLAPPSASSPAPPSASSPAPPPARSEIEKSDWDVVPVFYGTDRAPQLGGDRLAYGSERGRKLQLGRALVTVPKAHVVPKIERPWVLKIPYFQVKIYEETEDPKLHFTMQELKTLSKDEYLTLIKARLAASATFKDHAFVFIHGFNTPFDYAVYRTAQIANDIKFDGVPFMYSWPSGGNVGSYTYDFGSVEQAEPFLKEFLDIVLKESGAKSISIIAHSMGNQLLLRVLENLRPTLPEGVKIAQVILAAPDVDRDKFENIASVIKGMADGVTLYAASNDVALGWARRFHGGVPRAGDVPVTGPLIIQGIDTVDVTAASTDSLGLHHSGYAENNRLLNDIGLLIKSGQRPPNIREPSLESVVTERGEYWRYPAGVAPTP